MTQDCCAHDSREEQPRNSEWNKVVCCQCGKVLGLIASVDANPVIEDEKCS